MAFEHAHQMLEQFDREEMDIRSSIHCAPPPTRAYVIHTRSLLLKEPQLNYQPWGFLKILQI